MRILYKNIPEEKKVNSIKHRPWHKSTEKTQLDDSNTVSVMFSEKLVLHQAEPNLFELNCQNIVFIHKLELLHND